MAANKMFTPFGRLDHLIEELFSTTGAKAFPEFGHAAGVDRQLVLKVLKTTKVLPVGIFQKAIQNRLIAFIEGVFQIVQANHQSGGTELACQSYRHRTGQRLHRKLASQSCWPRYKADESDLVFDPVWRGRDQAFRSAFWASLITGF